MTEEVKTCDCKKKFMAKLKDFALISGAVFVGATLAILLSANILKPKCPCKGPMMPPRMERHMPPHMMHYYGGPREFKGHHGRRHFVKMHRHGDFDGRRDFKDFRGKNLDKGDKKPVANENKK